jgi:hypothetical protein
VAWHDYPSWAAAIMPACSRPDSRTATNSRSTASC